MVNSTNKFISLHRLTGLNVAQTGAYLKFYQYCVSKAVFSNTTMSQLLQFQRIFLTKLGLLHPQTLPQSTVTAESHMPEQPKPILQKILKNSRQLLTPTNLGFYHKYKVSINVRPLYMSDCMWDHVGYLQSLCRVSSYRAEKAANLSA